MSDDAIVEDKPKKRKVSAKKKPYSSFVTFKNLTGSKLELPAHTIDENSEKQFYRSVANALMKTPLISEMIRLKRLKVVGL